MQLYENISRVATRSICFNKGGFQKILNNNKNNKNNNSNKKKKR